MFCGILMVWFKYFSQNLFIPGSVKRSYAYFNCESFYGKRNMDGSE